MGKVKILIIVFNNILSVWNYFLKKNKDWDVFRFINFLVIFVLFWLDILIF